MIPFFNVGDFIPWLSDHCPLRFTLEFNQSKQNIEKESNMKDVPKQFIWTQEGIAKFQKELNKIENTPKIDNIMLISDENPILIAQNITDFLIAEKAKVKIATKKKNAVNNNPPWFDKTCSKIKKEIKSIGRKETQIMQLSDINFTASKKV